MTKLANDQPTEDLSRAVAARLLEAANATIADGVRVPSENALIFSAVYSWWWLVCRTSRLVLRATEPGEEFGYTSEVAPLVRNVFNHAFAIHWLVDAGEPEVEALVVKGDEDRRKLIERMADKDWPDADNALKDLERYEAQHPPRARTQPEQRVFKKLRHEIGEFYSMLECYGSDDLYPLYSHLSALLHTSIDTANLYLQPMPDGSYKLRTTAVGIGHAYVIHMAIALLQAAEVVSPLVDGDPMRSAIEQATADLRVEGDLLPRRIKKL